jgi:hypothetical protein
MTIDQKTTLQELAADLPTLPHGHVDNAACDHIRALAESYPGVTLDAIGRAPAAIARAIWLIKEGRAPTGGDIPPAGGTPIAARMAA